MSDLRPYPVPSNETARARSVAEMGLHQFQNDPFFIHVTDLVKALFGVPVAFVSLFTEEAQEFIACQGLDIPGTPRTHSLCAFTVAARKTIVIPNALKDERSFLHPVVTDMGLRFSASAPVILSNGFCMGTVCGVDLEPHDMPSGAQVAQLDALAAMIARFYEAPKEPDADHLARMQAIAEEAQSEFLALIGHELRTPLNGIHGMAQVLEPGDDEEAEVVEAILQSAEHLHKIIGSVLAFTEVSNGDIQLDEGKISLDDVVAHAVRAHRKLAQMQGRTLLLGNVPPDITLRVDVAMMELALSCLVNNCVAHGGAQATVSAWLNPDKTLTIEVTDNGSGIPEDRLDEIWEAFRVGEKVHDRRADGMGLGLPLSRRVIELHGGDIHMEKGADGMNVTLRLPHYRVDVGRQPQRA